MPGAAGLGPAGQTGVLVYPKPSASIAEVEPSLLWSPAVLAGVLSCGREGGQGQLQFVCVLVWVCVWGGGCWHVCVGAVGVAVRGIGERSACAIKRVGEHSMHTLGGLSFGCVDVRVAAGVLQAAVPCSMCRRRVRRG